MNLWLEVINSRQKLGENLVTWNKYTFAVCRKRGSKSLLLMLQNRVCCLTMAVNKEVENDRPSE